MALRGKQQAFVDEYMQDHNATQAAIRAGYSKKTAQQTGSENLLKPVIAAEIAKRKAELSEKSQVDALWVLNQAVDLYKECRDESDRTQANKALDTIGKHVEVQAWKDKVETHHSGSIGIGEVLAGLDGESNGLPSD